MKAQKPLLGLCPLGKFVFSNEDAIRYKKRVQARLTEWQVPFVDLEGLLPDGLVKDQSHVDAVVEHFRRSGIDGLFLPHCNFGTEGAVGMIAQKLQVPALLWGPRDEAPLPDGTRLRDTLCGLLASSKVLHKLNIPFTYIENCRVDENAFQEGVDTFLRAVAVANVFRKGIRIGLIGQRIDFFWTTIINESDLLARFHVEVIPLGMSEFIEAAKERVRKNHDRYEQEVAQLRAAFAIDGFDTDIPLLNILAVRDQLTELAEKHGLDGFAFQTFMSIIDHMGAYCMYADCCVSEQYAFAGESDIHGAISDIILRRVNFNRAPAFLTEFTVRHPQDDNAVLLWHFGAPLSLRHPQEKLKIGHHWILPSPLSGMVHFRLKDGPITVARFDGDHGNYQLAIGQGQTTEGPRNQNNYVWLKVDHWPRWERILIEGPFIHHIAMAYGHYAKALAESTKYIPGLEAVFLNDTP